MGSHFSKHLQFKCSRKNKKRKDKEDGISSIWSDDNRKKTVDRGSDPKGELDKKEKNVRQLSGDDESLQDYLKVW
ncbi:hypothetical protein Ancab_018989 [Ancistrocladus abbreviatus]